MRIAVMQPYFFPYLGYFEMISSVDRFVLFTDCQYIRRGWINRNRIRKAGGEGWQYLTVPVRKAPLTALLSDIEIDNASRWHEKHCRTLETIFGSGILHHPLYMGYKSLAPQGKLLPFVRETLAATCSFLSIPWAPIDSAAIMAQAELRGNLSGAERKILGICKALGASTYVNLPGGAKLYDGANFTLNGVRLEILPLMRNSSTLSVLDLCLGDDLTRLPSRLGPR